MAELIAFRALQGLGAGGLMVVSLAIIGDIVAPRERGSTRATSARSSASRRRRAAARRVVHRQPLWRWIFYINLPVGIARAGGDRGRVHRRAGVRRHGMDYLGAAMIAAP